MAASNKALHVCFERMLQLPEPGLKNLWFRADTLAVGLSLGVSICAPGEV